MEENRNIFFNKITTKIKDKLNSTTIINTAPSEEICIKVELEQGKCKESYGRWRFYGAN